uniref:Protein S-acyltransferase n=1 Tax=Psilocybe cubensis TaxID=181762 RepID=A0A8H7Y2A7_PSICU
MLEMQKIATRGMAYLVLSTFCLCASGYDKFFDSIGVSYKPWDHHVPEIMFAMMYILSIVLCFAVGVMLSYHLYGISWGETTVEAQDHDEYRKKAKARNEEFVNSYDVGSLWTLILPLRINPYTDGFSWARRDGYERHQGIRQGEELTDEEDDDV